MAEPTVDDLPAEADALQAVELRRDSIGDGDVLEPHRHAYHELIWVHDGHGRHLIDGEPVEFGPRTLTLIPKGQVHQFKRGRGRDRPRRALRRRVAHRLAPLALLAAGRAPRSAFRPTTRPASRRCWTSCARRSSARPGRSPPSCAATCSPSVLLWAQRWREAQLEGRGASGTDVELHRQFQELLERDFATSHEARPLRGRAGHDDRHAVAHAHEAHRPVDEAADHGPGDPRGRPAAALQRPSIKEIAARLGFGDQFAFSEGLQAPARGGPARLPRAGNLPLSAPASP